MDQRHDPRFVLPDGIGETVQFEYRSPFGVDGGDLAADAAADFREQRAEPAEFGHQNLVSRRHNGPQAGLDPRARGTVHQEGPFIGRAVYLAIEGHGFVHVLGELRIELPKHRHGHGALHPWIDIDGARSHQQSGARIEVLE